MQLMLLEWPSSIRPEYPSMASHIHRILSEAEVILLFPVSSLESRTAIACSGERSLWRVSSRQQSHRARQPERRSAGEPLLAKRDNQSTGEIFSRSLWFAGIMHMNETHDYPCPRSPICNQRHLWCVCESKIAPRANPVVL